MEGWERQKTIVFWDMKRDQLNETFYTGLSIFLSLLYSTSITDRHTHKLPHISIILPMSMRVMVMHPGRRWLMLCASNHITVSCKLMFLAWSLLIRMLDSALSTAPPALCTGITLGGTLWISFLLFFLSNNCWGDVFFIFFILRTASSW